MGAPGSCQMQLLVWSSV